MTVTKLLTAGARLVGRAEYFDGAARRPGAPSFEACALWCLSLLIACGAAAPGRAWAQIEPPAEGQAPAPLRLPENRAPVGLIEQGGSPRSGPTLDLDTRDSGGSGPVTGVSTRPASANRGVTVASRSRSDYNALPIRVGSFELSPSITGRVVYDSNVFSQPDGNDDVIGLLRPSVRARSDWSRHAVVFDGTAEARGYSTYGSENGVTYDLGARGQYDVDRGHAIRVDLRHARRLIDRGAVGEVLRTRRPVRYETTSTGLSTNNRFGRFSLGAGARIARSDFEDAFSPAGELVSQRFRNSNRYEAGLDVAYLPTPARSVFASVNMDLSRFRTDVNGIVRDSDGVEALIGVRSEITPLIRGTLAAGFIQVTPKDDRFSTNRNLSFQVDIDYLVTELTTVNLLARRFPQNPGRTTVPTALATELRVGADHELLRNVILSAAAIYQSQDYADERPSVTRWALETGASWLVGRAYRLEASVTYRTRQSETDDLVTGRDFSQFTAGLGVRYAFGPNTR